MQVPVSDKKQRAHWLARKREYRKTHIEKEKAYYKTYYETHKEEKKAKVKVYYEAHKKALNTSRKTYYRTYRERYKERLKAYQKAYSKAHPEIWRAKEAKRRALKQGNTVSYVNFRAIAQRDGMRCHICKKKIKPGELSFDHIVPLSRGGSDSEQNIRVAHLHCNKKRGAGRIAGQMVLL